MRDVLRKQAEALDFVREGEAYIHSEYRNGETDVLVSGHAKTVVWLLMRLVEQVADKTGAEVSELLGLINALHIANGSSEV